MSDPVADKMLVSVSVMSRRAGMEVAFEASRYPRKMFWYALHDDRFSVRTHSNTFGLIRHLLQTWFKEDFEDRPHLVGAFFYASMEQWEVLQMAARQRKITGKELERITMGVDASDISAIRDRIAARELVE